MRKQHMKPLIVIITLVLLLIPLAGLGCGSGPGRIAYICAAEVEDREVRCLYLMNGDGSGEIKLVDHVRTACISPDGTKIVYTKNYHGTDQPNSWDYGMYVIDTNGQNNTKVLDQGFLQYAWSPDSTEIAFVDGGDNIGVMNADGTDKTRITPPGIQMAHHPSWSPDGAQIVFSCWNSPRVDPPLEAGVYTMNADGTDLQLLIATESTYIGGVAWSPDGTKIAYIEDFAEIRIANADGSDMETIFTKTAIDETTNMLLFLAWSPDGKKLVFQGDYEVENEIFPAKLLCAINADGTGFERVADEIDTDGFPSWGR